MKRKWTAALLALMLVLALPFSAAAETFSNDDFSLTYPDGMYLFTLSTSVDDPSWALAGIADPQSELQTMQDMSGIAQLVSEDGSTTILVAVVKGKDVTKESINAAMKAASSESFGYNTDEIVSSDVIGIRYGSLFDATQTMVTKLDDDTYQVQVVSWYDNENSYTSQMVRTIKYFAEL